MTADTLRARTCKDLAALARKHGVNGWHEMRKDQLVRALLRVAKKPTANHRNGDSSRSRSRKPASMAAPGTGMVNGSNRGSAAPKRSSPRLKQFQQARVLSKNIAGNASRRNAEPQLKDRVVVMVRDSYWLHVYWELRRQSVERAAAALGHRWHGARPVLRLMEIVSDGTRNTTERVLKDIEIHGGVNNWYLHVDNPPTRYRVAIGYRAEGNEFYSIVRSNMVTTPAPDEIDELDRNWDDVARNFEKIFAMSGGYEEDAQAGDLRELFEERLRRPMGSPMVTRFGAGAEGIVRNGSGFHFEVDAEMIVYGVATPNSHVRLRGEPVQLRKDGSFTVRLNLPDRRQVIPVVANSADGVEQRTIVLAVERNTKTMETLIREPEEPLA